MDLSFPLMAFALVGKGVQWINVKPEVNGMAAIT
jgi:hypothetical protein